MQYVVYKSRKIIKIKEGFMLGSRQIWTTLPSKVLIMLAICY